MNTSVSIDREAKRISDDFEASFLSVPLSQQIANCDHYELAALFRRIIPGHQPMLEAGCGSGRWVAWAVNNGWKSIGIDWSEALCEQARKTIPGGIFYAADMRSMPVDSKSIGCILSLGAIEHASEGPDASLKEYLRVLRSGGVAIITVPYLSPARKIIRAIKSPLRRVLEWKRGDRESAVSRNTVRSSTNPEWAVDYLRDGNQWSFFQYLFTRKQITDIIRQHGFSIEEAYPDFIDEGVLHTFGSMMGRYDHVAGKVRLNGLGRLTRSLLPASLTGHMFCVIAKAP